MKNEIHFLLFVYYNKIFFKCNPCKYLANNLYGSIVLIQKISLFKKYFYLKKSCIALSWN